MTFILSSGKFEIEDKILQNLRELNLFFVSTYLVPWFTSTIPAIAPRADLQLAKSIIDYPQSQKISEFAGTAFRNQLWYLHGVTVGLSFFDDSIPLSE